MQVNKLFSDCAVFTSSIHIPLIYNILGIYFFYKLALYPLEIVQTDTYEKFIRIFTS